MLRLAILSLFLASACVQASTLTLGVVLDQDESLADSDTTKRYRAFSNEIERAVGQPVHMQYFTRGFSAIKQAKEGTLNMVFGPAQVIANISKFKFEPIVKTEAVTAVSFVASPNYKGTLL